MQNSVKTKRGSAQGRKRRKQTGRRFIQLWINVKRSDAYHSLSPLARSALFEVLDKYTGINNGMIIMSARDLAERLKCSKDSVGRALRELDDAGLVRPMEIGTLKGRRASTYRLTFYNLQQDRGSAHHTLARAIHPRPTTGTQRGRSVRPQGH